MINCFSVIQPIHIPASSEEMNFFMSFIEKRKEKKKKGNEEFDLSKLTRFM